MKQRIGRLGVGLMVLVAGLMVGEDVGAAPAGAKWLPGETCFFVRVDNVTALREKFKSTATYGLYKDPAMQAFMVPAEQKIRAAMDEGLKEMWGELGLADPPKEMPLPEGKVMVGFFVQPRTRMVSDYAKLHEMAAAGEEVDYNNAPQRESTDADIQVVGLAQMGDEMETVQRLFGEATSKAVEKGSVRQRERARGVEITIVKDNEETDENYDTLCYGFKDDWLIVGSSLKYMKEVLVLMTGGEGKSLAEERDFKDMQQTLGAGDVSLFINGQRIIEVVKGTMEGADPAQATTMIETLGFANTSGFGMTANLAPSKSEEIKIKALLGVRGEKKGIPALLTPETGSFRPNRLLSKGMEGFGIANYDIGKIYDGIVQMVWQIGQMNLDGLVQGAMMATGTPGEGGQAPVDLKAEVLGQLRAPITTAIHMDKPYTAADSMQMMFGVAVRDSQVLDAALARIHNVFVAQGQPEMRRELSGSTIYLLPDMGFPMMGGFGTAGGDDAQPRRMGFAVVGDQFVFGAVKGIEQEIRNLGRKEFEAITSDPMFQYAKRHMPSQAGAYSYENGQIGTEAMWVNFKEAARQAAARNETEGSEPDPEMMMAMAMSSPMHMYVELLKEYCDFGLLPEFEEVKKYFGVSVSHAVGTEKGLYIEMTQLKAPQQ